MTSGETRTAILSIIMSPLVLLRNTQGNLLGVGFPTASQQAIGRQKPTKVGIPHPQLETGKPSYSDGLGPAIKKM